MGLIQRTISQLTAPWRLCVLMEAHVSAQNAMLHDLMGVSRVQAETNARMAEFLQSMQESMVVEGSPEGRTGLSDEEELMAMIEMRRIISGQEDN